MGWGCQLPTASAETAQQPDHVFTFRLKVLRVVVGIPLGSQSSLQCHSEKINSEQRSWDLSHERQWRRSVKEPQSASPKASSMLKLETQS